MDYRHNTLECCKRMLDKWLETEWGNASWDQLIEALQSQSVQLNHLASQIRRMLDMRSKIAGSGAWLLIS